ncbi:MAG: carbohydrate binding family 9 domain-containing protein [Saprospirales bacterium]|nr:carbohydrate binding family 9 domain-containing protein [Saprospirales bacterium]
MAPVVDGSLSDSVWQMATMTTPFWMKWPRDGGPAPAQTEVRCVADQRYLYLAVTCWHTGRYVLQSLKRDVGYWDSDGFAIVLDPSNAANNGYFFAFSAAGVQTEALLAAGVEEADTNWDNTWLVETRIQTDRWTAEVAIPLRILRFKEGQNTWGINFIRNDLVHGIYSTWAPVPFQFSGTDLGWTGALHWETAPRRVKGNYNLIPYATAALSRDYTEQAAWALEPGVGLDAKVGVGSGLNLDLTLNPDFSQIEIDEQVVNLTRFDIMLPEKRTFFLENADLFGNFGIPPVRPFFSRRIGLNADGEPVPILGGLRLTGNLGSDTRIGLLTMQTRAKAEAPAHNYSALALRHRLFGRSTVGAYFCDREEFRGGELQRNAYSRNGGVELVFTSADGAWSAWSTYHHSFLPGVRNKNSWGNTGVYYSSRRFSGLLDLLHMGENYRADAGFEQRIENYDVQRDTTLRIGYNFIYSDLKYRFFSVDSSSRLNFAELGAELFQVINPNGSFNESSNELSVTWNFKNTSEVQISVFPALADVPVPFKFDDDTSPRARRWRRPLPVRARPGRMEFRLPEAFCPVGFRRRRRLLLRQPVFGAA